MKFTFDRDAMIKEIAVTQEIISNKSPISILSNILLIAENNTLTIKASDSSVNFVTKLPVDIQEEGTTTIFCDKFMSILSSSPSGEIEFEQKDITVTIRPYAKKIKFQLKSMASDKFPEFTSSENVPYFDIPAEEFKNMITQTIFALSDDESRLNMNGVFFEKNEDNLNMVSTDGRRLAYISKPLCQGVNSFPSATVPPKILNIILKRAPSEGFVSVSIVEKMIFIKFGSYKFTSVLIDGMFPNYRRVIPESQTYNFQVEKADLQNALKRVGLLVDKKIQRIYLDIKPGTLTISSQEPAIGIAKEEIPCRYDGEEITIAVSFIHIEEPLKVMNTDRLNLPHQSPYLTKSNN